MTVFSILIGIATIFIFISFGAGLYNYVDTYTEGSSADKLLIMAKGGGIPGMDDTIKLTDEDIKAIEKVAGIYGASGAYFNSVKTNFKGETKYTFVTSYDPRNPLVLELFNIDIISGRSLNSGDLGVVLGYSYLIDGKIFEEGLEVNDIIEVDSHKLKVLGFFEEIGNPADDANIYMTNDRFLELFPSKTSYAEIVARAEISNLNEVIEDVEKNLRKERDVEKGKEDFYVQSFEDLIESFSGALDVIIYFIILIALISVLVSAINTANTMITSVLERYKEIGVLKAIGARNSEIITIFLFESAFLGFISGVFGVLLGWGLSTLAGSILKELGYGFLQPYFTPLLFIGLILFAILTGAISGVFPAIKASKINVVDSLRYE